MRLNAFSWTLISAASLLVAGCDDSDTQDPGRQAHNQPAQHDPDADLIRHKPRATDTAGDPKPTGPQFHANANVPQVSDAVTPATPAPPVTASSGGATSNPATSTSTETPSPTESADDMPQNDFGRALYAIGGEIAESLKVRPTLVVWLIDATPNSSSVRGGVTTGIPTAAQRAVSKSKGKFPLSSAVVTYGQDVNILTSEPATDMSQLSTALAGLQEKKDEHPATFAAVNQAADKFLSYRAKGMAVIFVIAADTSGDDWAELDQAIPKLRSKAVPVFGMGAAVPFGRPSNLAPDKIPSESFSLERIGLQYPPPNADMMVENDMSDSGYGPFGLERLCHETKGRFFRLRSGDSSPGWKVDSSGDIDPETQKQYAPDYVTKEQYQKLLSENRCRQALVDAARLPYTPVLRTDKRNLTVYFTRPKNEAQLANMVTNAQKPAAEKSHDVDQLYDVLVKGEPDRSKLTGARWQAAYDLAMGRVMAAKARIDGYNSILATIKQGKAFKNPSSSAFKLTRAETISSASALNKMATNSVKYLNRVMKDNAGTPWAALAERELTELTGWELGEE